MQVRLSTGRGCRSVNGPRVDAPVPPVAVAGFYKEFHVRFGRFTGKTMADILFFNSTTRRAFRSSQFYNFES